MELSLPIRSLAVDFRVEKAKAIRDEILAKRAAAAKVPRRSAKTFGGSPEAPDDPGVQTAKARLAEIDERIQASLLRGEAQAAPREKLSVRVDELTAEFNRIGEANRVRVEAVYRSGKLGAGAAGWDPEPARSARLSRYLACVASAEQERLSKLEVQQGSVLAALDKARTDDASAASQRKVLEADRIEAQAAVDRALEASTAGLPAREALLEPGERDSVGEAQRAMAQAAAKLTAAGSTHAATSREPAGPVSADGDFRWPSGDALAAPPPGASAGQAANPAKATEPGPDSEEFDAETAPDAEKATGADPVDDGEMDDGPAVLAPSADAAGPAPADGALPTQPPGLLQRLFDDGDSDRFSAARGTLPLPVAGKVVANYGQQHKSGGTYRGVILRATHGAAVRAVAAGQVSFVGNVAGLGNTVIVSHGSRYHTVYGRLGKVRVKRGDEVDVGTRVGELPDNDADLHFELRDEGKAVNPVPWLKSGVPGAAP